MIALYAILSIGLMLVDANTQCPDQWQQSTVDLNKCYKVVVSKKNWNEAENFCQNAANISFLTSIASAFEASGINGLVINTPDINMCSQFWIGANDFDQEGRFSWSDGQVLSYSNWDAGQPDLNYKCVSTKAKTTSKWTTDQCGKENCFICEKYITAQMPSSTPLSSSPNSQHSSTILPTTPSDCAPVSKTKSLAINLAKESQMSMTDCYDWLHIGGATLTGIYEISPPGIEPFHVYCDMDTAGGGWTVFHKRKDDCLNFWDRKWNDYKLGFNNGLDQNFWLGLDRIHILSSKNENVTLRIDIHGSRCPKRLCGAPSDGYWFGEWQGFKVDNEFTRYKFHIISTLASNVSLKNDTIIGLNGAVFSTADRHTSNGGCEQNNDEFWGPWWAAPSNGCFNGKYDVFTFNHFYGYCVLNSITNQNIFPVRSELKLRKSVQNLLVANSFD